MRDFSSAGRSNSGFSTGAQRRRLPPSRPASDGTYDGPFYDVDDAAAPNDLALGPCELPRPAYHATSSIAPKVSANTPTCCTTVSGASSMISPLLRNANGR